MKDAIKPLIYLTADDAAGLLLGTTIGAAVGGITAGILSEMVYGSSDERDGTFGLAFIIGGSMGLSIGAQEGMRLGAELKGSGLYNVGAEAAGAIYNTINSYAFKPLINGVSNIAGSIGVSAAAKTATAYEAAKIAAKSTVNVLSENQLVIAAAVTAATVGTGAYMFYQQQKENQQEEKRLLDQSLNKLKYAEDLLSEQFNLFSEAINRATNKDQSFTLRDLHNKFITQYFSKDDNILETTHRLSLAYNQIMKDLPEKELQDFTNLTGAMLETIGKCQKIRDNLPKSHADKVKESRQNQETDLKR